MVVTAHEARSAFPLLRCMPWSDQQCNWLKCMAIKLAMVVNISSALARANAAFHGHSNDSREIAGRSHVQLL